MQPTKPFELAAASTQAWWSSPGLVYFLGVGSPVIAVKIGMLALTKNQTPRAGMGRRLSQIQSSNHELVSILGLVHFSEGKHPTKDAEDMERHLHLKFRHLARFKANSRGAEWFNAAPDLLDEIEQLAQSPESLGVAQSIGQVL